MGELTNIFDLHKGILDNYRQYIFSFLNIVDQRIKKIVIDEFEKGRFWPKPLIQFNPNYLPGESLNELIQAYGIHSDLDNIFNGFQLFKHHAEAMKIGAANKGFVVTFGTGSGKSLTYQTTIFNHYLSNNCNVLILFLILHYARCT